MPTAVVVMVVITVGRVDTWRETAIAEPAVVLMVVVVGFVTTAVTMDTWQETAIVGPAAMVLIMVVVVVRVILAGGKDTWPGSALVDVDLTVAEVAAAVAVEWVATTVGKMGTLLENAPTPQQLNDMKKNDGIKSLLIPLFIC